MFKSPVTSMIVVPLPAASEPVELPQGPVDVRTQGARRAFTRSHTFAGDDRRQCGGDDGGATRPKNTPLSYEVPPRGELPSYAHLSENAERDLGRLFSAIQQARRIAVVCGAGVSVSSPANIPDFRSATGLFRKLKEKHPQAGLSSGKDLFDARLFASEASTSLFYSMIAELKDMADAAQPTVFHHFLKRLDQQGRLQRVYTQNIDGLEEKAGLSFGLDAGSWANEGGLGKRKRLQNAGQRQFARSKSDSAAMISSREDQENAGKPLFPRTIPLHGTLSTLTCALCTYKLPLTSAATEQQAREALEQLRSGEAVWCPRCETTENMRISAGMRPRGVGRMKVDVVLYNGENTSAEHVGACVERDILGLRDPNEPMVPETPQERRARERKEQQQAQREPIAPKQENIMPQVDGGAQNADDVLAAAFMDDDGADVKPATKAAPAEKPRRLKPLPPDLLIVAGTSLKVPGTKRIVREFAKACRAKDTQKYGSDTPGCAPACTSHEAPIRTVYLNYDFPSANREWGGVFDIWIQGDVQRAALGLCDPSPCGPEPHVEEYVAAHSWRRHCEALAQEAEERKRPSRARPAAQAKQERGETPSAAAPRARTRQEPLGMVSGKLSTAGKRRGKAAPSGTPSAQRTSTVESHR